MHSQSNRHVPTRSASFPISNKTEVQCEITCCACFVRMQQMTATVPTLRQANNVPHVYGVDMHGRRLRPTAELLVQGQQEANLLRDTQVNTDYSQTRRAGRRAVTRRCSPFEPKIYTQFIFICVSYLFRSHILYKILNAVKRCCDWVICAHLCVMAWR